MEQNSKKAERKSKKERKPQNQGRPLSAYNLFYRYKRIKILEATPPIIGGEEALKAMIMKAPGLEDFSTPLFPEDVFPLSTVNKIRRDNIRLTLSQALMSCEVKTRAHRKGGRGVLSFVKLSRLMAQGWKQADPTAKQIFHELFEEGRTRYLERAGKADKKSRRKSSPSASSVTSSLPVDSPVPDASPLTINARTVSTSGNSAGPDHQMDNNGSINRSSSMMYLASLIGSIPTPDFTAEEEEETSDFDVNSMLDRMLEDE